MSKEGYVPLSEVNSVSFYSRLSLPFGLEDKIGVNVKKAEWLTQVGGIRHVIVKNDPAGETTQVQRAIVGMNSDGSAMAGATKVDYAPTSSGEIKQDKYKTHTARWSELTIKINTEELKSRLLQSDNVVSKANAWAPELDRAIKKEIRATGNQQLLKMVGYDNFSFYFIYGMNLLGAAMLTSNDGDLGKIALSLLGSNIRSGIIWTTINSMFYDTEKRGTGNRISLGVGMEIDRAILFNMSFLGKPLIADLTKKVTFKNKGL